MDLSNGTTKIINCKGYKKFKQAIFYLYECVMASDDMPMFNDEDSEVLTKGVNCIDVLTPFGKLSIYFERDQLIHEEA